MTKQELKDREERDAMLLDIFGDQENIREIVEHTIEVRRAAGEPIGTALQNF